MSFRSSSVKRRPDCPLTVLVWVYFVVVTGFIQRRCCLVLLCRRRDYELVFCGGLCQIMSFFIWFLLSFSFMLVTFVFVLFREDEDGCWLCSGSMIWSENLESDSFFWIEDLGYLVLALFCWMHISTQHDSFYLDVSRKG